MRFRNDAEAAIVGEAAQGAGRGSKRVIGITLGTGMGSAFLVDGHPVTDGAGVPERGWLFPVDFNGQRADEVFSTRGLLARFSRHQLALTRLDDVDLKQFFTHEVLSAFGHDLGAFLRPFALRFNAETVLVLGGISNLFDAFGPALNAQLAPTSVIRGNLQARATLIGAAMSFKT